MIKKYGLIGYPLTHSFSKRFFTEKFEKEGIFSTYENFEIDNIARLPEVILNNPDLIGLNVTIPYKEQVIPYLNELNDSAHEIGAVNTIRISRSKTGVFLKGFNTDTYGFENSLKPLLKPMHNKALILGTGGASKALKYILANIGIDYISASTNPTKKNVIRYNEINEKVMAERLLIINATPLGTFPKTDASPEIPYEYITENHLLYDLVYNPELTMFMEKGLQQGATVKNGYEMLLLQAKRSYEIWNSEEL